MKKYLKFSLDAVIKLAVGFVGLLFSLNVLAFGFLGLPELMTRIDVLFVSDLGWLIHFVPGCLPLFYILTIFILATFSMYATLRLIQRASTEEIISAIKRDLKNARPTN